jgi:hypothetical protein
MYMMGIYALCWAIWVTRNEVTIDDYVVEGVFTMCSFLLYWTVPLNDDDKAMLIQHKRKLMNISTDVSRSAS